MLWTIKELVALFNKEHDFIVTYYSLQQVIKQEKHIFYSSQIFEDDCRRTKCENAELLLTGIVNSIRPVYPELAAKIKVYPVEFVKENICSLQSFQCCSSECQECSQAEYTQELLSVLEETDEVTYAK